VEGKFNEFKISGKRLHSLPKGTFGFPYGKIGQLQGKSVAVFDVFQMARMMFANPIGGKGEITLLMIVGNNRSKLLTRNKDEMLKNGCVADCHLLSQPVKIVSPNKFAKWKIIPLFSS